MDDEWGEWCANAAYEKALNENEKDAESRPSQAPGAWRWEGEATSLIPRIASERNAA
jgi:hypothetical protein